VAKVAQPISTFTQTANGSGGDLDKFARAKFLIAGRKRLPPAIAK
jgi:hypothetical protein